MSKKAKVAELEQKLATAKPEERAALLVALGSALLEAGDAKLARENLIEAAALARVDRALAALAGVRLAAAELALGDRKAATSQAARALSDVVASNDAALLEELASVLAKSGETIAAEALEHLRRRGAGGRTDRSETLARVIASLNSCAAGTAEPLLEILKAVIEETRAARGFLMLHEGAVLRFELGLAKNGRRLAADDFACSTTIVERALDSGRPVLVPDMSAELPFALASSARSLGLRSALCAPLRVEKRRSGAAASAVPSLPHVRGVAGVLYVDSTATGSFEEEDARFFQALADATVLALRASGGRVPREEEEPEPVTERSFAGLETRAPSMARALWLLERVAATDASVVLHGESGTGKELFARALHASGRRAKGPFVALECSAVGDELVRHELFGHEDGAFTGAGLARAGLVERASGGTLFLDGVDEMPPAMQAALLRVLQEGEVRRLGADRPRPVDVRLVAATQRDLAALVEKGAFRHDFLFRLAVVEIKIPPLRERLEDLEPLVASLLDRLARAEKQKALALGAGALDRLAERAWPGTVRELENVLRAAALATKGSELGLAAIEATLGPRGPRRETAKAATARSGDPLARTLEEIERRAILERLESNGWNQLRAAESLGLDRTTLRRKLTRYGISPPGRG